MHRSHTTWKEASHKRIKTLLRTSFGDFCAALSLCGVLHPPVNLLGLGWSEPPSNSVTHLWVVKTQTCTHTCTNTQPRDTLFSLLLAYRFMWRCCIWMGSLLFAPSHEYMRLHNRKIPHLAVTIYPAAQMQSRHTTNYIYLNLQREPDLYMKQVYTSDRPSLIILPFMTIFYHLLIRCFQILSCFNLTPLYTQHFLHVY